MPSIDTTMATHRPHTLRQSRASTTSLKAEDPHRSPFWRKKPKSAPIGIAVSTQHPVSHAATVIAARSTAKTPAVTLLFFAVICHLPVSRPRRDRSVLSATGSDRREGVTRPLRVYQPGHQCEKVRRTARSRLARFCGTARHDLVADHELRASPAGGVGEDRPQLVSGQDRLHQGHEAVALVSRGSPHRDRKLGVPGAEVPTPVAQGLAPEGGPIRLDLAGPGCSSGDRGSPSSGRRSPPGRAGRARRSASARRGGPRFRPGRARPGSA